jgi:hypothetical protein
MKRLLIQYTWILGIAAGLFLLVLLTGCNQPPFTQGPIYDATEESTTQLDSSKESSNSIGNMESIAHALGCVFAPDSCNKQ